MTRSLIALSALVLLACAPPFEAEVLRGELARAGGDTFFATSASEVRLGITDEVSTQIEYVGWRGVHSPSVCAVSGVEAWAVVNGGLLHRTSAGWEEFSAPELTDYAPRTVGCVNAGHVVVRVEGDPSNEEAPPTIFEITRDGVTAQEAQGIGGEFTTSPRGELLSTGSPPHVLRDGRWLAAPPQARTMEFVTGGHVVHFAPDGTLRVWNGDALEDRSIVLDAPRSGRLPDELIDVLIIGDETWAVIQFWTYNCTTFFGSRFCDRVDVPTYRVLHRPEGGSWSFAGFLQGPDFSLVDLNGRPYAVFEEDGQTRAEPFDAVVPGG